MKNLITKTLICGVMASSVLLANCQPGPKRAAKADITPSGKIADPLEKLKGGECSKEFLEAYKVNVTKQNALRNRVIEVGAKKETLDDAAKTDLTNLANDLAKSSVDFIAMIDKMTGIDFCKAATEEKEKSKNIPIFKGYKSENARLGADIKAITGQDNDLVKAAVIDDKKKVEQVKKETEFKTSQALADVLDKDHKNDFSIVNGEISMRRDKQIEAQKDNSKTVCLLSEAQDKLADGAKLTMLSLQENASSIDQRKTMNVSLIADTATGEGKSMYGFKCLLAATAKDNMTEFKTAMGAHLVSSASTASGDDSKVVSGDGSTAATILVLPDNKDAKLIDGKAAQVARRVQEEVKPTAKPVQEIILKTTESNSVPEVKTAGDEVPTAKSITNPATTPESAKAAVAQAELEKKKLTEKQKSGVVTAKVEAPAVPQDAKDDQAKIGATTPVDTAKVEAAPVAASIVKNEAVAAPATAAAATEVKSTLFVDKIKSVFKALQKNSDNIDAIEKANRERIIREGQAEQQKKQEAIKAGTVKEEPSVFLKLSKYLSSKNSLEFRHFKQEKQTAPATTAATEDK